MGFSFQNLSNVKKEQEEKQQQVNFFARRTNCGADCSGDVQTKK